MEKFFTQIDNKVLRENLKNLVCQYNNELYEEKRQQIFFDIQEYQNELNLRIISKSAKDTRVLTWIVIILTFITIVLSIATSLLTMKDQAEGAEYNQKSLMIQNAILKELKDK